jgi:hypothetical protein
LQALDRRRAYSAQRIRELQQQLSPSETAVAGKACIYLTGSFGRNEGCEHSDVDLFIVGRELLVEEKPRRALTNLQEICIKAELIRALDNLGFEKFSGDGEYLEHYTITQLVRSLGRREDDAENTFTARLLLVLESQPLIGGEIYDEMTDAVLASYWRDYEGHETTFLPAFLTNDILRLWRTFCVNYEAHTQNEPLPKKYKKRLKNYKLKHSRMLTCYSALLFLMAEWNESKTVSPSAASTMVKMTPTERIESLKTRFSNSEAAEALEQLLIQYDKFLEWTAESEREMLTKIAEDFHWRDITESARVFAELMFRCIKLIGDNGPFHRMLIV